MPSPNGLPLWMDDVERVGDEERHVDCPFPGFGEGYCSSWYDVGVGCFLEAPNATLGEIRLRDSVEEGNSIRGRLEVFYDGEWGTFCGAYDSNFNDRAATVACRQLGCSDKFANEVSY